MDTKALAAPHRADRAFHHESLLYAGPQEFTDIAERFVRDGLAVDEPVMVATQEAKLQRLREALGADAERVEFADMAELGRNPSLILPAWRAFVDRHARDGRPLRGIGEPVWAGRSQPELEECLLHESLLNLAFAEGPPFWLLCPYDASALDEQVIEAACERHPFTLADGRRERTATYRDPTLAPLEGYMSAPERVRAEFGFKAADLPALRATVALHAQQGGLIQGRVDDLVVAVNEIATNSLQYGGGAGLLRIWEQGGRLVCEVRDGGRVSEPLVGRETPSSGAGHGRGLWMANHLCDLVQLRSSTSGTVARLHMDSRVPSARQEPAGVVNYPA